MGFNDNFISNYMDETREILRKQFNEPIDKRVVEILHSWGKKYNISELSLIETTDDPITIKILIDYYKIHTVESPIDGLGRITCLYSPVLNEHDVVYRYEGGAFYVLDDKEAKDE